MSHPEDVVKELVKLTTKMWDDDLTYNQIIQVLMNSGLTYQIAEYYTIITVPIGGCEPAQKETS